MGGVSQVRRQVEAAKAAKRGFGFAGLFMLEAQSVLHHRADGRHAVYCQRCGGSREKAATAQAAADG